MVIIVYPEIWCVGCPGGGGGIFLGGYFLGGYFLGLDTPF